MFFNRNNWPDTHNSSLLFGCQPVTKTLDTHTHSVERRFVHKIVYEYFEPLHSIHNIYTIYDICTVNMITPTAASRQLIFLWILVPTHDYMHHKKTSKFTQTESYKVTYGKITKFIQKSPFSYDFTPKPTYNSCKSTRTLRHNSATSCIWICACDTHHSTYVFGVPWSMTSTLLS